MKIKYSKDALKFLAKTDRKTMEQIRNAISKLKLIPPEGDIKILQGYSDKRMRLRVGKYRVVYKYDECQDVTYVYIIDIDSRGGIYK